MFHQFCVLVTRQITFSFIVNENCQNVPSSKFRYANNDNLECLQATCISNLSICSTLCQKFRLYGGAFQKFIIFN